MDNNIVSIIIPCYNDADYIEQSVISAINQTYQNTEIIVVDDGSSAETKAILYKLEPLITRLIIQENRGQSTARNVGIKHSKGHYLLMLDSDDYLEPAFCEKAIKIIESKPEVKIVTCYARRFSLNKENIYEPTGGDLDNFLLFNAALGTSLIRRSQAIKAGGYDETMTTGFEDWEFFIRLLKNGGKAYVIKEPLYNYRMRENSTTSKANSQKYDLLKFIYNKHKDLYKESYEILIDHLLKRIEREEKEKIKNLNRIEYRIGAQVLKPLRFIKGKFKR